MRVQESEALPPPAPGVAGRRGIPHGAEAPTDPFGRASMPRTARKSPTERCRGSHCANSDAHPQNHPTLRHRRAQAESWRVLGLWTCGIVGLTRRRPVGKTVATPRIGGGPSRAVSVGCPCAHPGHRCSLPGFAAPLTIHRHASGRRRVGSPWRTRCCAETRLHSISLKEGRGRLPRLTIHGHASGRRRVGSPWRTRCCAETRLPRSASRRGGAGFLDKARSLPRYGAAAGRRRRAVRRPRGQGVARASSRHGRPRGQRGLRGMRRRSNAAAFLPRASEHRSRFEPR